MSEAIATINNEERRRMRQINRDLLRGPLVGDFVKMPQGEYVRISYDWGDSVQTSQGGSFYLWKSGNAQFSGGLDPAVSKSGLRLLSERRRGRFWFFDKDWVGPNRGVDTWLMCRVYQVVRFS